MRVLVALMLLFPCTSLATLLPPPKGPYHVSWEAQELIDGSRADPFNSSHSRRLMISRFTPVAPTLCRRTCRVPWMDPVVAAIKDINLQSELGSIQRPFGELAKLEMEVCCETLLHPLLRRHEIPPTTFPTILFAPGLNTTRLVYSATAQHLSSLGYEVIVIDHPYETEVVQFPNGDIVIGGHIIEGDESSEANALAIRTQDASFVLDSLRAFKTVYIGHSFGGSAAAYAQLHDDRILSSVNLDGLFEMPTNQSGVPRPLLDFRHDNKSWPVPLAQDHGSGEFFAAMAQKHPRVWTKALSLINATHNSFADFGLMGDVLPKLRSTEELQVLVGKVSGFFAVHL